MLTTISSNTYFSYFSGFYLFLQVEAPLHVEVVKLRHYLCIGWGLPLLVVGLWSFLTYYLNQDMNVSFTLYESSSPRQSSSFNSSSLLSVADLENLEDELPISANGTTSVCPFLTDNSDMHSEWAYKAPVFLILACNMVFLVYIMTIVICKLRSENLPSENHRQHWRAAKALLVIFPLLGISYVITLVVPPQGVTGHRVFQYVRALLLSLQVRKEKQLVVLGNLSPQMSNLTEDRPRKTRKQENLLLCIIIMFTGLRDYTSLLLPQYGDSRQY